MKGQSSMQEEYVKWRKEKFNLKRTPSISLIHRSSIELEYKHYYESLAFNEMKEKNEKKNKKKPIQELGMVIMAGGMSTRYESDQPKQLDIGVLKKELFSSIDKVVNKEWRVVVYLVCSPYNIAEFYDILKKESISLQSYRVYLCQQPQEEILDEYGLATIYEENQKWVQSSNGIGSIFDCIIEDGNDNKTIKQHIQSQNIQYVYCYGVCNESEKGLDPLKLGYLIAHPDVDMVFSCCEANSMNEELPRVCRREVDGREGWQVLEYDIPWAETLTPESLHEYQQSLVWMHHFVFRTRCLNNQPLKASAYEFLHRSIKGQSQKNFPCIIGEKKISVLMGGTCHGIVQKRSEYFPIITVQDYQNVDQQVDSILRKNQNISQVSRINKNSKLLLSKISRISKISKISKISEPSYKKQ